MSIQKEYERIATILRVKFSWELSKKDPRVAEVVVILVLSLLMGWDNASEVTDPPRPVQKGGLRCPQGLDHS